MATTLHKTPEASEPRSLISFRKGTAGKVNSTSTDYILFSLLLLALVDPSGIALLILIFLIQGMEKAETRNQSLISEMPIPIRWEDVENHVDLKVRYVEFLREDASRKYLERVDRLRSFACWLEGNPSWKGFSNAEGVKPSVAGGKLAT